MTRIELERRRLEARERMRRAGEMGLGPWLRLLSRPPVLAFGLGLLAAGPRSRARLARGVLRWLAARVGGEL